MKARISVLLALLLTLAASSPALAQAPDRRDVELARKVQAAINTYPSFTIFDDLSGSVAGQVVTLNGKVTMPYKKSDIESRISRIDGVKQVVDNIQVLPVSVYDDELRARIARAIYRNPSFWSYAMMANPPIHIVVEHGRVTLTGVVNSRVDKALAQSLASGFGEFALTNDLRTDM